MNHDAAPIYLDHNATTPVLPEVVAAMLPYLHEHFGNPSSSHVYGWRARDAVEHARAQVAQLLGAAPDEIVFTSGGTEANNLAIRGVTELLPRRKHLVTSKIEHPATVEPCRHLQRHGWEVTWLAVDRTGRIGPLEVANALRGDTALLTIIHANNETGTIQPVAEAARTAHAAGAIVHTDAAQSAGKIPVRVDDLGVDLLSIAGHKVYAPKGVGALYIRRGTLVEPLVRGAGHERGLRPGTENVASIVGLGAACEIAHAGLDDEAGRVQRLRDVMWKQLCESVPGLLLNGHADERLPNTLNLRFPDALGTEILALAPEVAASTGSACHEGGEQPSAVLTAMGIEPEAALGSIRLSLGRRTTDDDIERAALALADGWRRAARLAPRQKRGGR